MNKFFTPFGRKRLPEGGAGFAAPVLAAPAGVRFIPGEKVLLLAVTLPKMPARQRRIAASFAVEDRIAQGLEDVHVVLGPELTPGQWLVAVVARADLPTDLVPGQRVLPDTLALPIPPQGHWSMVEVAGRMLIRLPDGTGMVTNAAALPLLHLMAGAPGIVGYGGQIGLAHEVAALPPVDLPAGFDLIERRGQTVTVPPLARRLLAIAVVAVVGHLAILTVDTVSLSRQQDALAAQLRVASGTPADADIDALLARILAPPQPAQEDRFLPLLSASFAAMAGQSGNVTLREVHFAVEQGSLTLTLLAPDLGVLQQVEADLALADLTVTPGPASSANGTAEQVLTVRGPPS